MSKKKKEIEPQDNVILEGTEGMSESDSAPASKPKKKNRFKKFLLFIIVCALIGAGVSFYAKQNEAIDESLSVECIDPETSFEEEDFSVLSAFTASCPLFFITIHTFFRIQFVQYAPIQTLLDWYEIIPKTYNRHKA